LRKSYIYQNKTYSETYFCLALWFIWFHNVEPAAGEIAGRETVKHVAYSLICNIDKRQGGPENAARRAEFQVARVDKILQSAILRRLRDRGPPRRPPGWKRHHNA
jgi:hypothetical protein